MQSSSRNALVVPSHREKKVHKETADLLSIVGQVTIGYGLTILLFACLPLKLVDPAWQLKLSGAFTASGPFLLIGVMLVCMARAFNDSGKPLISRVKLLRYLSIWVVIIYLVLIPIQLHAGVRLLRQKSGEEAKTLAQWKKFKAQLQATSTEQELRFLLGSLPQPIPLPAKIDIPFVTLKQKIIADTDSRFNSFSFQTTEARSQRWQNFISEAASNCLKTLLMALGFAAFAQGRPGDPTLLDRGLTLISKGSRRRGSSNEKEKAAPSSER